MLEIAQESFHLVLNVEVLQVVHSLSLYASARNRVVIEVLGGREKCFFGGNAFLFNTKSGFICQNSEWPRALIASPGCPKCVRKYMANKKLDDHR